METDEKPYFIYIVFYVCLAIIKKNIYDTTKDESQKKLFIKYCKFIKNHFGNYMKKGLRLPPDFTSFGRYAPESIPAKYGLKGGLFERICTETFAGDFLHNFIDDLHSYLKRAPKVRDEMLIFL